MENPDNRRTAHVRFLRPVSFTRPRGVRSPILEVVYNTSLQPVDTEAYYFRFDENWLTERHPEAAAERDVYFIAEPAQVMYDAATGVCALTVHAGLVTRRFTLVHQGDTLIVDGAVYDQEGPWSDEKLQERSFEGDKIIQAMIPHRIGPYDTLVVTQDSASNYLTLYVGSTHPESGSYRRISDLGGWDVSLSFVSNDQFEFVFNADQAQYSLRWDDGAWVLNDQIIEPLGLQGRRFVAFADALAMTVFR